MPRFDVDTYIDVQDRINRFWTEYPRGAIRTRLMSPPDDFTQCRYEAAVYKDCEQPAPDATGYAFELAGGNGANATSHEENCETSAIGRALANMGYATSREDRPSRQEMEKVNRGPQRPPAPIRQEAPANGFPDPVREVLSFEWQQQRPTGVQRDPNGGPVRSDKQMKAIFAIAAKVLPGTDIRAMLHDYFRIASTDAMTVGMASRTIDALNAMQQNEHLTLIEALDEAPGR